MFHYAADITRKALNAPGEMFRCFAPFDDVNFPDGARLYGFVIEVPDTVSEDFTIDVLLNGDSIYANPMLRPQLTASNSTRLVVTDFHVPFSSDEVVTSMFEVILVQAATLPTGGLPAGVKVAVIFDDGVEGGGGGMSEADMTAAIDAAVAAHEAAADPHPQYLRQAEADLLYEAIGGGGGGGGGANAAVNALEDWGASIVGATEDATTNALTKTAASGWGNSGAFGVGAFPVAKGMVLKYLGDPTNGAGSAISVGITAAAADQSQSYDTADYNFISYLGGWTIYENGVEKYNVNANTAYSKGEEFEIRLSPDGIVTYWFNGILKYTSSTIAVGTYHADIAISANGGRVPPVITRADVQ